MTLTPSACERLAQSRERLRQAMRDIAPPPALASRQHTQQPNSFAFGWMAKLKDMPGAGLLLNIFQGWWTRQPLSLALTLATETGKVVLQPVAQRHPYGLVFGAAVVGGLLAFTRPWRWISTPAMMSGLLPQLVAEVIKFVPDQSRDDPKNRE